MEFRRVLFRSPLSESRLRRGCPEKMGPGAILHRTGLLQFEGSNPTLSRGDVVRILPRGTESHPATRRSQPSQMGQSELECGRAVFLDRPYFLLDRKSTRL